MKVLLIYPEMPDTFYAMKHFVSVIGKKAVYPPLGLITVAALLPKEWDIRLKDLNSSELKDEDISGTDIVFISAMNVQERSVTLIAEKCKAAGVKTVAGGPLFTHEYEKFPDIDHYVLNEAEITLPMFLEDLRKGKAARIYRTDRFAEIKDSPAPLFSLVNMNDYMFSIVQYSRGCPHKCDFCDVTALFGRIPRIKTAEQIIAELEMIRVSGKTKMVLFADDNLIGNRKCLKNELLPAVIEWRKAKKPPFFFSTQLTADLIDDRDLVKLMIDAGFRNIFVGIETPEYDSLEGSMKSQNLKRDLMNDILELHRAGFIVAGGFIVGFDQDGKDIFKRQADFIQKSGIPLPIVNVLKAPPGTELYSRMKKEGRITTGFAFLEADTNIVPAMGFTELMNGYFSLTAEIYKPENSYKRLVRFFDTYISPNPEVKVPEKFSIEDVFMALRIFFLAGIISKNRYWFWKIVIRTLFTGPSYLDKAVLFGIMIDQMYRTHKHIVRESFYTAK
jgi:radical SAM superfamily enzyme YgiQ (UPF0313 family)